MQTTVGTVKRSRSGFSAVHVQQSIGPIERNRCKIRWRHSYRWRRIGFSVATRPCRFLSKRRHTIAAGLRETRACEKSMVWRNRYVCTFYFPIWFFFVRFRNGQAINPCVWFSIVILSDLTKSAHCRNSGIDKIECFFISLSLFFFFRSMRLACNSWVQPSEGMGIFHRINWTSARFFGNPLRTIGASKFQ